MSYPLALGIVALAAWFISSCGEYEPTDPNKKDVDDIIDKTTQKPQDFIDINIQGKSSYDIFQNDCEKLKHHHSISSIDDAQRCRTYGVALPPEMDVEVVHEISKKGERHFFVDNGIYKLEKIEPFDIAEANKVHGTFFSAVLTPAPIPLLYSDENGPYDLEKQFSDVLHRDVHSFLEDFFDNRKDYSVCGTNPPDALKQYKGICDVATPVPLDVIGFATFDNAENQVIKIISIYSRNSSDRGNDLHYDIQTTGIPAADSLGEYGAFLTYLPISPLPAGMNPDDPGWQIQRDFGGAAQMSSNECAYAFKTNNAALPPLKSVCYDSTCSDSSIYLEHERRLANPRDFTLGEWSGYFCADGGAAPNSCTGGFFLDYGGNLCYGGADRKSVNHNITIRLIANWTDKTGAQTISPSSRD